MMCVSALSTREKYLKIVYVDLVVYISEGACQQRFFLFLEALLL